MLYRCDDAEAVYTSLTCQRGAVEFMTGPGHKISAFGLHHKGGRPTWDLVPGNVTRSELPRVTQAEVTAVLDRIVTSGVLGGIKRRGKGGGKLLAVTDTDGPKENELFEAMAAIPNPGRDWVLWNMMGMALFVVTSGAEIGREVWQDWSDKAGIGAGEATDDTSKRWRAYQQSPPDRIGWGWICALAKKHGFLENGWAKKNMTAKQERLRKLKQVIGATQNEE
jgi:hypothetical protein